MSPSGIFFDDALWPLLRVRFVGVPTEAQFEEHLARRMAYMQRGERHVLLYDTSQARLLSSGQRQRLVSWMREHAEPRRQTLVAGALVITSPFFRLTVNLILHVVSVGVPLLVTATEREAALWAAERLLEEGYPVPAQRIRDAFLPPGERTE